jgi:hypothetical protein
MTWSITYNNIMAPNLTRAEQSVIQQLRRLGVATMRALRQRVHCCHMTVVRALRKTGYHNSFNANAAYYTLPQTPVFDDHGLWFHRQIGFSQHGNLLQTLAALVANAPAGCTVPELEAQLSTPVANLLCRLGREGRVGIAHPGRHALYLAADPAQQRRQQAQRQAQTLAAPPSAVGAGPALPPGVSALEVVALLTTLIQHPHARVPTLVRLLRKRGVGLSPSQIRQAQAFYELKKKRHLEPGEPGSGPKPPSG